ncbi:hypothetical protein G6F68_002742 [Rhizopus microsporus]|nr:hypothetical protein G6F67_003857 [Rhizopus microsporus]KAG1266467.1 hypothetical protein G6F68_002742 [Rhizopus microsporus]
MSNTTVTLTATITQRIRPTRTYLTATIATYTELVTQLPMQEWERQIYRGLPVILAFAIIGILTISISLCYLAYRIYNANTKKRYHRQDAERELKPKALSHVLPWFTHQDLQIEKSSNNNNNNNNHRRSNLSPTFVPIHTSLNLVPRSEILNDPERRRGVDELDMWEKKKQSKTTTQQVWKFPFTRAYPESSQESLHQIKRQNSFSQSSTITMQGASFHQNNRDKSDIVLTEHSYMEQSSPSQTRHSYAISLNDEPSSSRGKDIQMARKILEECKHNSSQWLHFSGSKSF